MIICYSLPFCEAVVLEALRIFMANTLGVAHRALRSTKLCGFDIPKVNLCDISFTVIHKDNSPTGHNARWVVSWNDDG